MIKLVLEGASSAGTLAHETKEQQLKAEAGVAKGVYPKGGYNIHKQAIKTAEDRVNGNRRVDNSTAVNVFYEPNGTKTIQTVTPNNNGGISVIKKNVP